MSVQNQCLQHDYNKTWEGRQEGFSVSRRFLQDMVAVNRIKIWSEDWAEF